MFRRYFSGEQGPQLIYKKAKAVGKSIEDLKTRKVPVPGFKGEPVYGIHSVLGAMVAKRRRFFKLYLKDSVRARAEIDSRISQLLQLSAECGIPVNRLTQAQMDRIANFQLHNGAILDALPVQFDRLGNFSLSLFLDGVLDPGNIGAVARNCLFFGAEQMIFDQARGPSAITPSMSKSSSGALEHLSITSVQSESELYQWRQSNCVQLIGTSDESSAKRFSKRTIPLERLQLDQSRPICLVLGSEENGIRPEVVNQCDQLVCIKGANSLADISSLNVSVVSGIILQRIHSMICIKK